MPKSGQLIYLMGASGAGKDSLIRYARQHLGNQSSILFTTRYITRPHVDPENETHLPVSPYEFNVLQKNGTLAMHWRRNGIDYGIDKEINSWLEKGKIVVINGSRQYLSLALEDYPDIHVILVKANQDLLLKRLQTRGRETPEKIEERMKQANTFLKLEDQNSRFTIIENNNSLKTAGDKFLELLQAHLSSDPIL